MTTPAPASRATTADLDAARLLLARMGLSAHDLLAAASERPPVPTFAEYIPVVATAVGNGTRRVYSSYWNRILGHWADRRLDDPTPSEIKQLVEHVKLNVVARRNARGGRSAGEHLIAALRCIYRHAEHDGLVTPKDNPASKVAKPRRLPSTRRAVADTRLAEINLVVATTGNDPALDALLLRLHIETACRRGGALALRPQDLDPTQCLIFLREKGQTVRWQPVSPTLMDHLEHTSPSGRHLAAGSSCGTPTDGRSPHGATTTSGHDSASTSRGSRHSRSAPTAAAHHPHLGRAELRLRRSPRLRGSH
jgi:integrase/recombinase XerC